MQSKYLGLFKAFEQLAQEMLNGPNPDRDMRNLQTILGYFGNEVRTKIKEASGLHQVDEHYKSSISAVSFVSSNVAAKKGGNMPLSMFTIKDKKGSPNKKQLDVCNKPNLGDNFEEDQCVMCRKNISKEEMKEGALWML